MNADDTAVIADMGDDMNTRMIETKLATARAELSRIEDSLANPVQEGSDWHGRRGYLMAREDYLLTQIRNLTLTKP